MFGAGQPVETTYTRTASNSGHGAKLGKRSDVYIGKTVLEAAEMKGMTDALSAVHHGRETRKRLSESGSPAKSITRDM